MSWKAWDCSWFYAQKERVVSKGWILVVVVLVFCFVESAKSLAAGVVIWGEATPAEQVIWVAKSRGDCERVA